MPLVQISTNLPNEKVPTGFEKRLSDFLAETLDKPIERITVVVNTGARVCNSGEDSPFMFLTIHSIDRFNKDSNQGYTDQIVPFVQKETNLPGNKIQILYSDIQAYMVGKGK